MLVTCRLLVACLINLHIVSYTDATDIHFLCLIHVEVFALQNELLVHIKHIVPHIKCGPFVESSLLFLFL